MQRWSAIRAQPPLKGRLQWALCWALLWSLPTVAAEPSGTVPPELVTCYGIQQSGERLACYDRAVEYLRQPGEKAAAPSAEASFGLQGNASDARKSGSSASKAEQTQSVTAHVTKIASNRDGLKIITLDNGQIWRQVTSSAAAFIAVGDEVKVNRAALGSFLMHIPNGGPLRVRRIE